MAARRKAVEVPEEFQPRADFELGRIARLLGLIATKDLPQIEQVGRLRIIGFANVEIADILGITSNHVGVARLRPRASNSPASSASERSAMFAECQHM
jgi:hypothetical protein